VTTLAGQYLTSNSIDGTGTNAQFYTTYGIATDSNLVIYAADDYYLGGNVRAVTTTGTQKRYCDELRAVNTVVAMIKVL
jgi:hypothetical protein